MIERIKTQLAVFSDDVNRKIPIINSGGCGFFSTIVGKNLSKLGYDVKYHYLIRGNNDITDSSDILNNSNWIHIILCINNAYYMDSKFITDDVHDILIYYGNVNLSIPIEYDVVVKHLRKRGVWNKKYVRSKFNPILRKISKKYLTNIDDKLLVKKQVN
jgi:hypothetical protein